MKGLQYSTAPELLEPVPVLSTHRISSLEQQFDLHSNLEFIQAVQAQGTSTGKVDTTTVGTSTYATVEALGSLDISGRPQHPAAVRLPQVSEKAVNVVPVFKVTNDLC